MEHIKRFFYQIRSSFYNPNFYQETKTAGNAFSFLVILLAISSLFMVTVVGKNVLPIIRSVSDPAFVEKFYPEGVVVTVINGVASTNALEPFIVPDRDNSTTYDNFFVMDTRSDLSFEAIETYNSSVILTKNSLVVQKDTGEIRIIPLKDVEYFAISEEIVKGWIETGVNVLWIVAIPLALGIMFGTTFVETAFYLTFLLLGALFAMLIARMRHWKITYKQAYLLSMFAVAPVIIIDMVRMVFGLYSIPLWLISVIFLIVLIINLRAPSLSTEMTNVEAVETGMPEQESADK